MSRRALLWLGAGTVATAFLVTLVSRVAMVGPVGRVGFSHAALSASGPGVGVASLLVWGIVWLTLAGVVLVPLGVTAYRVRAGTYDPVAGAAWVVAALALFPALPYAKFQHTIGDVVVAGLALLGVGALAVAAVRSGREPADVARRIAPGQFGHVLLVGLVVVGVAAALVVPVDPELLVEVGRSTFGADGMHPTSALVWVG